MQVECGVGWSDRLHPQGEFGDQCQAAPAAAEQFHQVVSSHVLDHAPAGTGLHAVAAQQRDADDLIAHAQVTLSQAPCQPPCHQTADTAMVVVPPRVVQRQPLPSFGQQSLQVGQGATGFHRDGEIVHGVVDHPVETAAAENRMAGIQRWTPVQASAQTARDPGRSCIVPLAHQGDQLLTGGRGSRHGTMVP